MASTSVMVTQRDEAVGPSATYSYCSRPQTIPARRKYRTSLEANLEEEESYQYANLMYERRVVRGNTYALHLLPWTGEPDPLELQKQQEARRKALARKRAREQLQIRTPEPLEGRRHVTVQTELYLEELADRIVEVDVECQTDAFLDRPSTPLFVPAKSGRDVATQIWEGDLFDFDIEVKPMLEVLVGKTIEQALLEVMEEEELARLRAHQYAFHELRMAELAEVQRLEEQERRHREEKERRKKQQLEVLQKEKETSEKIAARAFAQRYLADLIPSVFGSLRESGYFYDPVERGLIRDVMEERLDCYEQKKLPYRPWLAQPSDEEPKSKPSSEELAKEPGDQPPDSGQPPESELPAGSEQPLDSDRPPDSDQPPGTDQSAVPDQPPGPDQELTVDQPAASDQPGDPSATLDLPQIPDQTQTAGQETAETESGSKEPEPE